MTRPAPDTTAISRRVNDVLRRDGGRVLSGLIRRLGDFQLAEDALQEASLSALTHWGRSGVPDEPAAWLMRAGVNKGIDQLRARQREVGKAGALAAILPDGDDDGGFQTIPDDRLRLIFTCCHPALEEKSRIALTLRMVCNLTTREIAAAFLDTEQTMGQRLSRAKAKIKAKGIPFATPEPDQWPPRLQTVLKTLYLIFTTGYVTADDGPRDLCAEGLFLARLLHHLCPGEPEIEGALALMLLTEARQRARIGADGALVPIEEQDAALWRWDWIHEAQGLLETAMARRKPGPFQIKAAIADCHMMTPAPDWPQMALLYRALWGHEPTPVVALNWAVVMAETGQPDLALAKLDTLGKSLADFQPWHAARGHVLQRLGRLAEARAAYVIAAETAPNASARQMLECRLAAIVT